VSGMCLSAAAIRLGQTAQVHDEEEKKYCLFIYSGCHAMTQQPTLVKSVVFTVIMDKT
jgi:hypothetical protein